MKNFRNLINLINPAEIAKFLKIFFIWKKLQEFD